MSFGIETPTDDIFLLPYNFIWPNYNATPPWYSALAQAEAIVVLAKAHNLTNLQVYKETADGILNSFFVDVKDGGVTHKTNGSGWWYELYADKGSKNPRVLNGMLWSLLAINEYYNLTKDPKAEYLFDQGILALRNNLHLFNDTDGYSFYDALHTPANADYQKLHVSLLGELISLTDDEVLKEYFNNWSQADLTNLSKIQEADIRLDENYIPYVNYGERDGAFLGFQRNPLTVDHVASKYYDKFEEFGDIGYRQAFLNNVNWIVENKILLPVR